MSIPRRASLWSWPFVLVCASCVIFSLAFYMLIATLPLYAQSLGIRESLIGLIIGIFALTSMVTKPWSGWATDRYGRLPVLWLGSAISLVASLLYGASRAAWSLFLLRILHGVGIGCFPTAASTIAADLAPPARRGEAMGYFGAVWALGIAVAPLSGVALVRAYGFETLFWITGGLGILVVGLNPFFKETRAPNLRPDPFTIRGAFNPRVFHPCAVVICLYVNYGALFTFLPLFVEARQLGNPGLFFTFYALISTVVRGPAGRLSDRVGRSPVAAVGLAVSAVAMTILATSRSLDSVLLAAALYGLGFGTAQPSLTAWTMDRVSPDQWGKAMGAFAMALELGIAIGSIVLGLLLSATGYPAVFLTGATSAALGALLCLPSLRRG